MFSFGRGRVPFVLPFFLLAVVGLSLAGQAGSAVLLLPFLLVKLFFLFFLIGMVFRFAGGGMPWGGRGQRGGRGPWASPSEPTEHERERAEAMRQAKEEVDRLFPDL